MRQRIYLVLIALLCVFIFYLLFLNGFRLFPDQTVGSDKAKDQTGLQESVIDQEPDSSDERWFQVTTKKTKPAPSTSRPFIYTRTSTEKSTQNTDIPTSKIIDETSTIKYETEETTTEPAIEDEVEHSTTQAHRHHTHRPHHDRKDHKHHHHTTASRLHTSTPTETPPVFYDHDFTVVTALIDIGRGKWNEYRRPLEKYHEFMENLLSLKNKMVIFVDESSIDFVQKYREKLGLMHQTLIHPAEFSDLPLHKYLDDAKKIIESEKANPQLYGVRWDAGMKSHPEANKAEYDVLVNSKTYFLYNVTLENPFDTEYFVWLDAGYGHGNQSVFPYDNMWRAAFPERKLTPKYDKIEDYDINNLYRRDWSVISGGFIAGDKHAIGQLYSLVHRRFIQLIYQQKVDDDQTILVLLVKSYPQLFHIEHGDWFDAFRIFSANPELSYG